MAEERVLVDARPIFHPTAGGRGIGNYSVGLLRGLVEVGASVTALAERPDDVDRLSREHGMGGVDVRPWRRDVVRQLLPDSGCYVATGLFLHPISFDPIPQVITEARLPVAGVMYDVIPYRYPERYQVDENARRQARLRACLARSVDVTVAISQFAADTAIEALSLDPARVRVIGTGVDPRFVAPSKPETVEPPTVVAVTGPDRRKNTEGLIAGWARVPAGLRSRYGLVVVSGGPAGMLDEWRRLVVQFGCEDSVEFAGAVSDERMVELLQAASLVVQPSIEEGFGLPVVEAAACGAVVICSNVSALPEVLGEPAATFDPLDPNDIGRSIARALTDERHRQALRLAAERAAARWRWGRVAEDLLHALGDSRFNASDTARVPERIAIVAAPGQPVGEIGDDEFLNALEHATSADVVALVDSSHTADRIEPGPEGRRWPAAAFGRYVKYHEFDHVITVLDPSQPDSVAWRVASDVPTHVLLSGPVNAVDVSLARARSVIVRSAADAAAVSTSLDSRTPILVLEPGRDAAVALAGWLASVRGSS